MTTVAMNHQAGQPGRLTMLEIVLKRLLVLWNAKILQALLQHIGRLIAKQISDPLIHEGDSPVLVVASYELDVGRVDQIDWRARHLDTSYGDQMKVSAGHLTCLIVH